MAHIGKKVGFGPVCCFRRLFQGALFRELNFNCGAVPANGHIKSDSARRRKEKDST